MTLAGNVTETMLRSQSKAASVAAHAALDALSPEDAGKGAGLFQTAYDLIRQGIDTIPEADRTVKKMPEPPKVPISPAACPALHKCPYLR